MNSNRMMKNLLACIVLSGMIIACDAPKKVDTPSESESSSDSKLVDEVPEARGLTVYITAQNTAMRLANEGEKEFVPSVQPSESEVAIFVNPSKTFQEYIGIGGAITDASAEVFAKLSEQKQEELLKAYFDPNEGLAYSIIRTNIHSCDFSTGSYTYIADGDSALETFSIDHDRAFRIPMIKRAIDRAGGNTLNYASPWSPPAFMKGREDMLEGGKLLPEFAASWAAYYAKFIKAYEAEGIPIWGITIQNEPMAVQRWESCIYTAEEERDFLKNHLGPTMEKEGLGDKKIVVWDHNRDLINHRANTIFDDPEASKYAWGIGFHWYETWTGSAPLFDNLGAFQEAYPDKKLLFTEGCVEKFDAAKYEFWPNAERYGRSMINDFNMGTVGWTDWNILLDHNGGPNHVGNFCFAPVHANTETGELIFTPSFYYIGHFSKFIRADAKRISTVTNRSDLLSTSFLNPDGSMATIVMNQGDVELIYKLFVGDKMVELNIPPHAMQTLVVKT